MPKGQEAIPDYIYNELLANELRHISDSNLIVRIVRPNGSPLHGRLVWIPQVYQWLLTYEHHPIGFFASGHTVSIHFMHDLERDEPNEFVEIQVSYWLSVEVRT